MDYIQNMFAQRIGGSEFGVKEEIFKFERIKRAKRQADIDMPDIKLIDLGVGEADNTADTEIIRNLSAEAGLWENRGYADNGIIEFQRAASEYLHKIYGVKELIPDKEILHVMGSKSALAMIPDAFIDLGDITLMTTPGYPILGTRTQWLGGEVYELPITEGNHFMPDLESIPENIRSRAKLLYLNYPNNPTGATATREFFEKVVRFARDNQILVIHDAAYGALTYNGVKPLSYLSIPGAIETGIELHSLSKAYAMTGWRLGFIAGNARLVKAIATVKDNTDSGQFRAIQKAGIYALAHPEITDSYCQKYDRRHKLLTQVLRDCGFDAKEPGGTFYEYIKIPYGTEDGRVFRNAEEFSDYLIRTVKISTVPWDNAGSYFRASVTFVAPTPEDEIHVMDEVRRRLMSCRFIFS